MHRLRVVDVLAPFLMATMPVLACAGESGVAAGPKLFRVRIEGGSAAAMSAPSSLELTTGWKQPCVLEVENRDAVRRQVSLETALPLRIVPPLERIVLAPAQVKSVPFLLQTLTTKEHEAHLTVGGGARECDIRVRIEPRPDPSGVRFGVTDHFDREGPMMASSVASPTPKSGPAGKPPKAPPSGAPVDGRPPKDLSHLAAAPTRERGESVLDAMRVLQSLGVQTYRMDVSWSLVEQSPGVFSWNRTDWMVDAIRSSRGADSQLVAQIGYQPAWLASDFPRTSEGRERHSRWVENVVSRYADRVDYWEIWNEPLLFWLRHPDSKPDKKRRPQEPLSPQETDALAVSYAQMILDVVRSASRIIRRLDPQATLLSPGFEDFFNAPGPIFPEFARKVYTRLLAGGMAQLVDGFCIHSYPAGCPGRAPRLGDAKAWIEFDRATDAGRLLQLLRQHDVHLPLYSTEFGGFRLPRKASSEDETAAALALLRNGCILAHQGFRLVTYYEIYDWDKSALAYLVRYDDGHRTRAFSAYQKLIAALTGATASEVRKIPEARILDSDYSGLVVKAFRRGPEDILCLWNNAATPRVVRLRAKAPAAGDAPLWEHVRFAPKEVFLTERAWGLADPGARDVELTVAPLDFHVLSRTSSSPGFEWLASFDVAAATE